MGNVNSRDKNGDTPLIKACKKNDQKAVKELIENKADVNLKNDKNGYTPLIIACNEGNEEIVKILIENGAKINIKDENGYTALVFACSNGNENIDNQKLVKLLIDSKAKINSKNKNGDSPLTIACGNGNENIIKYLIEHKAEINTENKNGYTPLIRACYKENEKIIKYLIDHGADVNKSNVDPPLNISIRFGNETIVKYLVDHGANVNLENRNGCTPLIDACYKGNEGIVKLLIDNKADVNIKCKTGETALTVACKEGNEIIVKYLVDHGANVNITDKNGLTPLIISCIEGSKSTSKHLARGKSLKNKLIKVDLTNIKNNNPNNIKNNKNNKNSNNNNNMLKSGPIPIPTWDEINKLLPNCNNDQMKKNAEDQIEKFLTEYPSEVYMSIDENTDIFEEFINQRNIRLISVLIKIGRDINNYMKNMKLPIEQAIENKDKDIVKELINLGANTEVRTAGGIKIVNLIKSKMPEYYKFESIIDRNSSIEDIINTKDEKTAKIIIDDKELNIDSEDKTGANLLQKAIMENNISKFNELIRLGANTKKANGLIQIMLKKQLETYGLDLKKMESESQESQEKHVMSDLELKNYNSIASEYIISGEYEEASKLINKYSDILKIQNEDELNLLSQMIVALYHKNEIGILEDLVNRYSYTLNDKEVAINKVNNSTPLHYIIEKINKSPEAIEILDCLIKKVDNVKVLDIENNNGMTALDCAIAINNIDAVKILYSKNVELKSDSFERKENIIHMQYALLNDNLTSDKLKEMIVEMVNIRKEKEKDITFENIINDNKIKNGQSLLHIASYLGKKDIVNYLLEQKKIKLDVKDSKGRTPIFYAILAQDEEIVKSLINNDKDKNILMDTDDFNAAPLNYAIITKNEEITSLLIPKTKDLSIHDKFGRTFLHYAVASQNLNIIESIFREISNYDERILDIQDIDGKTALHYAALTRNKDILNIFLRSDKINLELIDKNELKAIDYLLMGKLELSEVLDESNYNTIPGIIRKMIIKIKDRKKEMCRRNVLHSACQNEMNPNEAIMIVLEEKKAKIHELIDVPLSSNIGKKPLDFALENTKISAKILVSLIQVATILENDDDKNELLDKLIIYNRGDIAKELDLMNEYYEKSKDLPSKLYTLIKEQKDINKIKSTLGIPSRIDCKNFKLYDYAIVKDRYDWFLEFVRHEKVVDIEKVKERVLEFNSLKIFEELLRRGDEFIKKSLWKKASYDAREMMIQYYKNNNLLEQETFKAANILNVSMVGLVLKLQNSIYIKGLLHIAVFKKSKNLARVVIENYGDKVFKEVDDYSNTPLDIAIKIENFEMLTYLVMKGAPVKEFKGNATPIKHLMNEEMLKAKERRNIIQSDINTFKNKIKDMTKSDINEKDYLGNTLLFYAIENNNIEIVSKLIKKGANVNIKNIYKETPLYIALKYADSKIVQELIENNCNIHEMVNGKSMLHYALKRTVRSKDNVNENESDTKDSIAIKLLEKGVVDLAPSTINKKFRYDRTFGHENITQLMYYIMEEDKEKAEQLIKSEWIDLNVTDDEGITAYGYAHHKHFADLMGMMEAINPNIIKSEKNIKDFFGLTDKKTAVIATTGVIAAGLGILAKQTNAGSMAYDIIENMVIENTKEFLSQDTRESLEKVQEERNFIQEKAQKIIDSQAVKDAYAYLKNKNKEK
ncbi:ankyrin [Neocallimastix sp. 'constans']